MNLQMLLFLSVYCELFTVDWLQPVGFAENLDRVLNLDGEFLTIKKGGFSTALKKITFRNLCLRTTGWGAIVEQIIDCVNYI